jgi:hypothetical protein
METTQVLVFDKTIDEYRRLRSSIQKTPTFFEIAGFPSRENVYSNVLKFFLDSRQRHGFTSLILEALLKAAGLASTYDLQTLEIHRELHTDKGGFIDIVIRTKDLVIAVENKVFHHAEDNDFEDYSASLRSRWASKPDQNYIQLVLALSPDKIEVPNWQVVSYQNFLKNLSDVISQIDVTNVYHLYFADFIKNIQNHLIPSNMTNEQIEFLSHNEEAIEEISGLYKLSTTYIFNRRNKIFQSPSLADLQWEKRPFDHQIFLSKIWNGGSVKLVCSLEISSIYVEVDKSSTYYLDLIQALEESQNVNRETNVGVLIKEFTPIYKVSDEQVSAYLAQVAQQIDAFVIQKSN